MIVICAALKNPCFKKKSTESPKGISGNASEISDLSFGLYNSPKVGESNNIENPHGDMDEENHEVEGLGEEFIEFDPSKYVNMYEEGDEQDEKSKHKHKKIKKIEKINENPRVNRRIRIDNSRHNVNYIDEIKSIAGSIESIEGSDNYTCVIDKTGYTIGSKGIGITRKLLNIYDNVIKDDGYNTIIKNDIICSIYCVLKSIIVGGEFYVAVKDGYNHYYIYVKYSKADGLEFALDVNVVTQKVVGKRGV